VAVAAQVAAAVVVDPAIAATDRNLGRDRALNATILIMRFAAALFLAACAPSYAVPDVRDADVPVPVSDAAYVDAMRSDGANQKLDANIDAGTPDASTSLLLPGCSIAFGTREGVFKPSTGWGTIINGAQEACAFGAMGMSCELAQGVLTHFTVYDSRTVPVSSTDNRWVIDMEFLVSKTLGVGDVVLTQVFGANFHFQLVHRITAANTVIVGRAIGSTESPPTMIDPLKPVVAHVELDKTTRKISAIINGSNAGTVSFGSGVAVTGVQVGPYLASSPILSSVRVDYARYLVQTCP
jgi:hypothetical protein